MDLPLRKRLPHDVPLWIDPAKEIYFITVCCAEREQNQLAKPDLAAKIFDTVAFRNTHHLWFAHLFLLMPDHVHALLSFPPSDQPLKQIVAKWKEWTANRLGIDWQEDFFEHRLRHDESRREKADYILHNPVREGLVTRAEDWPYVFFAQT